MPWTTKNTEEKGEKWKQKQNKNEKNWEENKEQDEQINEQKSEEKNEDKSGDKLLAYYLSILAKKDYSEQELINKGLSKNFEPSLVREKIDWLQGKKFLSEERLAENILHYYGPQKGKLWLKQKMQQRLIKTPIIEHFLADFQEKQVDLSGLKKQLAQKYRVQNWADLDLPLRYKILGALQRRGFTSANQILQKWQKQDKKD